MKKLKDKLIHLLGGMTEEDIRIRTRPVRVGVFQSEIETLKDDRKIYADAARDYPQYMDFSKRNMASELANEMIKRNLIKFESEQEDQETLVIHATVRVVRPEV